jgi:metallophosphoesterase superfamily enzyme
VLMEGRSTRRPCFVHDNRLMILPAYGSSAGSINIMSPAFVGLFHWPGLEVTMLGRDRTYPVNVRRLVRG